MPAWPQPAEIISTYRNVRARSYLLQRQPLLRRCDLVTTPQSWSRARPGVFPANSQPDGQDFELIAGLLKVGSGGSSASREWAERGREEEGEGERRRWRRGWGRERTTPVVTDCGVPAACLSLDAGSARASHIRGRGCALRMF
jgi:hypothetical protein